jgi:hypothetical protein
MRWQGKPAGPESADEGEEIEFNWWKMTTSPREEIAAEWHRPLRRKVFPTGSLNDMLCTQRFALLSLTANF